jgi:sporulation related protein
MADNNFRSYRGRDARAPARSQPDDPLAELARLIGQSEPASDYDRDPRGGTAFDQPTDRLDWAAEDRYAQQDEPAEADDDLPEERYAPAQHADILPTFRPGAPSYEDAHEPPATRPFSPPARSLNGGRDYALPERPRFHDEPAPVQSVGRQPPGFLSQLPDDRDYDYPEVQGTDDQAYALEDYEEEAPAGRRRSGLVVVAAVLGLAVLGTAGAFAYRAMFGSSMLPSLPPIIKAEDGPNKIVPNKPKSTASDQADASATSGEKLVSREEQPVDVSAPPNPGPRVISTIPIFPDPNSGQAGVPSSAQGAALASGGAFPSSAPPSPPAVQANAAPASPAPSIWPPAQSTAPAPTGGTSAGPVATSSPTPRKVHTVIIRTDQMGSATADASAAPETPPAAPAPAPVRTAPPRAVVQQARPAPAPRVEANGPLSIVPDQNGGAPAPARVRTALARPAEPSPTERAEPAPAAAGGGYAVQVTSQRSEADAQAEFKTLRSKFPTQLGGRTPIIRRADLGAKGVYYRALVAPFASMEQATGMCTSLKAAGGSCIVQRD